MTVPSAGMLAHLDQDPTSMCEIWRIESVEGIVAAYANHTRDLIFNGDIYKASPAEPTRTTRKINLDPDSAELQCVYDSIITEGDLYSGRWRDARITKHYVCYKDLSLGSALTQRGFVGKISPGNGIFTVEFLSLSSRLDQTIGDLTSPIDRTRRADETGVDMEDYTHATAVLSATSRRIFEVRYVQPSSNYFQYGIARFTSGDNSGLEFEIKYSTTPLGGTSTVIELQKNTPSIIAEDDEVTLLIGYDGTRAAAKALGEEAVFNLQSEPDMPLSDDTLRYQP